MQDPKGLWICFSVFFGTPGRRVTWNTMIIIHGIVDQTQHHPPGVTWESH